MNYRKKQAEIKKDKILNLYYRDLRPNEVIVDNSSPTIAKELNYNTPYVDKVLAKHSNEKLQEIYEREVVFEEVKPNNYFNLTC